MDDYSILIKRIFELESTFIAIQGRKDTGKTDFGLHIMELLHESGRFKHFGTNIQNLENTPTEFDFIDNLPSLKSRCISLGKEYLFLLDELGDTAPKDQPWLNPDLVRELQKVRKYHLSLIGCSIYDVDRRVLNPRHFDGYFEKPTRRNKPYAIYHDWVNGGIAEVFDIQRTEIKFNTYNVSVFRLKGDAQQFEDVDITNAQLFAAKKRYEGPLSKPGYYDSVRRGFNKIFNQRELSSKPIVASGNGKDSANSEG